MVDLVRSGLDQMKFALNHAYLFKKKRTAAMIGWLTFSTSFCVEQLNVFVILTSRYGIGLVANFIALQVIGQFGTYFYASLGDEPLKALMSDELMAKLVRVQHTTSKRCKPWELTDILDEKGQPRPILVRFVDRRWDNKIIFVLYRLSRAFFVIYYFYFMPLGLMILSLCLPLFWSS